MTCTGLIASTILLRYVSIPLATDSVSSLLAQGVLCAADDTLEKKTFAKNFRGELVGGIDGMNHTHQCRDSKRLIDVVGNSAKVPVHESTLGATTVFPIAGRDHEGKAWIVSES